MRNLQREGVLLQWTGSSLAETAWKQQLQQLKITKKRHLRITTEGALPGTLLACGFPPDLVIISDDAGQFNVLLHALCWIHAERVFQRILPLNDTHTKELNWVHTQIWEIYADLKRYKHDQDPDLKKAINGTRDTGIAAATLRSPVRSPAKNT